MCSLTGDIMDYVFVAQGKTTIPGVDDAEELTLTDVRINFSRSIIFQSNSVAILRTNHLNLLFPSARFPS